MPGPAEDMKSLRSLFCLSRFTFHPWRRAALLGAAPHGRRSEAVLSGLQGLQTTPHTFAAHRLSHEAALEVCFGQLEEITPESCSAVPNLAWPYHVPQSRLWMSLERFDSVKGEL